MGEDEDSESDEDDEYDGCEETSLEAYTTPLDEDDCDVDEYNIFKQVIFLMQMNNRQNYIKEEDINSCPHLGAWRPPRLQPCLVWPTHRTPDRGLYRVSVPCCNRKLTFKFLCVFSLYYCT